MNKYSVIQSLFQSFTIFKILQEIHIRQFKIYISHSGINIQQLKVMSRGQEVATAVDEWRHDREEL